MDTDGHPLRINEVGIVECANAEHPRGAWHPAVLAPRRTQILAHLGQWLNRKAWGCSCPAPGVWPAFDPVLSVTASGPGSPRVALVPIAPHPDANPRPELLPTHTALAIRRRLPGDSWNPTRPNPDAGDVAALVIAWPSRTPGRGPSWWNRLVAAHQPADQYRTAFQVDGGAIVEVGDQLGVVVLQPGQTPDDVHRHPGGVEGYLRERHPEVVESYVAAVARGGPVEILFIPAN